MSVAAGSVAAGEAGDIADALGDSKGVNIALALGALGVLYLVWQYANVGTDVAEGAQDAASDVGGAVGETWDGAVDVADGAGDAVKDGSDFFLGGTADVVRGTGDVVEDGADFVLGGTADTVDNVGDAAGGVWGGAVDTADGIGNTVGNLF